MERELRWRRWTRRERSERSVRAHHPPFAIPQSPNSSICQFVNLPICQSPNPPILSRASQGRSDEAADKSAEERSDASLLVVNHDGARRRRWRRRGRRRQRPHYDRRRGRGVVHTVVHRRSVVRFAVRRAMLCPGCVVRDLRTFCGRVPGRRLLVDCRALRRGAAVPAVRRGEGRSAEGHARKARDHKLSVFPVVHNTPLSTFFFVVAQERISRLRQGRRNLWQVLTDICEKRIKAISRSAFAT